MGYRITFTFSKLGRMIYVSHLDLMRLFTRAMRRAELPLKMTEGFSPHPKFSIHKALKLGVASSSELATIALKGWVSPEDFKEKLKKQLPQGLEIINAQRNLN
ncbi:MAG: TIGR03936 family radical SAM-associated protein [Candidatus Omnitrophota bacterium]|nr:TIGR03936 family radical SAM-associated protein [Candidatus Omnitrophota bacterium]